MPNAYIFNEHFDANDRSALENVVRSAGFTPMSGAHANVSSLELASDVGVVGLPVAPEDEAVVNARMQAFAGAGIRVVCIWLHGEEGGAGGVPKGVGKYGTTVDIDSPDLTDALKGETDVWEEPGGTPSPFRETKRNQC